MSYITQSKEYLTGYDFNANADKKHAGFVMLGGIALYELTKDDEVKKILVDYADECLNPDGSIKDYDANEYGIAGFIPGRVYLFAYEITGDEKYKKAAELLIEQLKSQPRNEMGLFVKKSKDGNEGTMPCYNGCDALYPFYAVYGTKYDKKENYNDLVALMKALYKYSDINNLSTKKLAMYACVLADVTKEVSEEIYEHKRAIADMLKSVCKELVKREDLDNADKIMAAKALLKAGKENAILSEKYVGTAIKYYNEACNEAATPMHIGALIEAAALCSVSEN
ncbi:glycoside hydrolase family 88 protein [Falcatimonas sp. MSJ-15]|uniref:glycoside hydrolase family 88 protein n=1 Tax=Falcatimonas sp. MSJ-15 TaxID=2841515 RepID=UPI001C105CCD|nr:glycoside hydrolase family 88 protein [Falcatimonas sp. MSJ-15]MBU5468782.1 glycoside hydrolase family 88 protein [Falcatimonas sp. MSJ-15]